MAIMRIPWVNYCLRTQGTRLNGSRGPFQSCVSMIGIQDKAFSRFEERLCVKANMDTY